MPHTFPEEHLHLPLALFIAKNELNMGAQQGLSLALILTNSYQIVDNLCNPG